MADNSTRLNATGVSETVASDEVGAVKYQVMKLMLGADGAASVMVDDGQQTMAGSIPVVLASDQTINTLGTVTSVTGITSVVSIGSMGTLNTLGSITGTVTTQPFSAIIQATTGAYELVGINDQVDQNDYGDSVTVALAGTYSGEILQWSFYATEDDANTSGAIQDSAGKLFVCDADPGTTAGTTAMSTAGWMSVIGAVDVQAVDWISDTNGAFAFIYDQPVAFHSTANLYFAWLHKDATSLNDAAADNEQLEFNFWYRRES